MEHLNEKLDKFREKLDEERYVKVDYLLKDDEYRNSLRFKLKELDLLYSLIRANDFYETYHYSGESAAMWDMFNEKLRQFICLVLGGTNVEYEYDEHLRLDLHDSESPETILYNNQVLQLFGELGMLRRVQLVYIRTHKGSPYYYCKTSNKASLNKTEDMYGWGTIDILQKLLKDVYFSRYYLDNYKNGK